MAIISLLRPFNPKNGLMFCQYVTPLAIKMLNVDVEIRRHDLMKTTHPCVFIANHQHALDMIILASIQCVPVVSIGKKELKRVPFFGWLFWLSGQIMIDRKNHIKAMESMREAGKRMNRDNVSVWIFPEGTRSRGKPMQPFKKGAFHLAISAQVPLLPIVASSFHKTLNLNKWNPGKIIVNVLDPISTQDLSTENVDGLIERTHKLMTEEIEKLDRELLEGKSV